MSSLLLFLSTVFIQNLSGRTIIIVTVVWQHDDASVVNCILIEVVVIHPHHHVNLSFGTAVNVEVVLMCPFSNKRFLPVSCTTQWRVVLTLLGCVSLSAVSINLADTTLTP